MRRKTQAEEVTSHRAATAASKVLRNTNEGNTATRAVGSAPSQSPGQEEVGVPTE